jgi:hypothetical protein
VLCGLRLMWSRLRITAFACLLFAGAIAVRSLCGAMTLVVFPLNARRLPFLATANFCSIML